MTTQATAVRHEAKTVWLTPRRPALDTTWKQWLEGQIRPDWRPGEWDHEAMIFTPDPGNPTTAINICRRAGCGRAIDQAVCSPCANEARAAGCEVADLPPLGDEEEVLCLVSDCEQQAECSDMCYRHYDAVYKWARHRGSGYTDEMRAAWLEQHVSNTKTVHRCEHPRCDAESLRSSWSCRHFPTSFVTRAKADGR